MLSLISKSLLVTLAILVVAFFVLLIVDEKSTSTAASLCRLRDGHTVVVRTIYHSSFARTLRALTGGRLYAITLWHRIYVANDYLVRGGLAHEHEHVRQWHDLGRVQFALTYLWQLVRYGYDKAPLEVLARHASGEVPWLR